MLHLSVVQNYIIKNVTFYLSNELSTKVEIGEFDYRFFDTVILKKVHLDDQNKDNLLYINKLKINLDNIDLKQKIITLDQLSLDSPDINIYADSNSIYNYQFLINYFINDTADTTQSLWQFTCNEITIQKAKFNYHACHTGLPEKINTMNFNDLSINNIDIEIHKFIYHPDSISFDLEKMHAQERCGMELENLRTVCTIYPNQILCNNLTIYTPKSKINALYYVMNFNGFSDFKDFENKVKLDTKITSSIFNLSDLQYFSDDLRGINTNLFFRGKVKGKISRIKGKDIQLFFGNKTRLTGEININGLPELNNSFIHSDINLITCYNDLKHIPQPPFQENNDLEVPVELQNLGLMKYTGKLTGFYSDFVTYGTFQTALGIVSTDLSLKQDSLKNLNFSGNLTTNHFKLGDFINAEQEIKDLSMNAKISGKTNTKFTNIKAKMQGDIMNINVLDYDYKNIQINGNLSNKKFEGSLTINDPNIDLLFNGNVDFNTDFPVFNFVADLKMLRLSPLHLPTIDSTSTISCYSTAQFSGIKTDDVYGTIELKNIHYTGINKDIKSSKLTLMSSEKDSIRNINLQSDYADIDISGKFIPSEFKPVITDLLLKYFPALNTVFHKDVEKQLTNTSFDFSVIMNAEINSILSLYNDSFQIAENSYITGTYSTKTGKLASNGHFDYIQYDQYKTINTDLSINTDDQINASLTADRILYSQNINIQHASINSVVKDNRTEFSLIWDNRDTLKEYSGELYADIIMETMDSIPVFQVQLSPSLIVIENDYWYINDCNLTTDTSRIKINKLIFNHNNQYIYANGVLSDQPQDTLYLIINDIQLADFNYLIKDYGLDIRGVLKGNAKISNVFKNIQAQSNIIIDDLTLNTEPIGRFKSVTNWNNDDKRININANIMRGKLNTISLKGDYLITDNRLSLTLKLNKLKLNILDPFTKGIISHTRGIANGDINISGTTKNPVIDGNILLQKTSFTVDYLNTRYNFTHKIHITDHIIKFDSVKVYDSYGNYATAKGTITHNTFKNFDIDISLISDKFQMLNTSESDNEMFYGEAFGSGTLGITGNPNKIHITANMSTDKIIDKIHKKTHNTRIMIPLNNPEDLSENDFVHFLSTKEKKSETNEYKVDLSGITMDFNFEVDPDAEIQIIFDSKVGDVIHARGNADLLMEINTQGDFNMYGEYSIEEGDYLFTLQNVINKKFKLEKGSSIKWNGNPYMGYMNVDAVYRLKTSLNDLTMDSTQTKRVPVECRLKMTEDLLSPKIKFEVNLPSGNDEINNMLSKMSDDELNKQVLSLLVLNRFYTSPAISGSLGYAQNTDQRTSAVGVTSSELLSNQLSHWLSQISNDFDIGVNYRPGDELTSEQLEVALSTQLLNDRVEINGNLGVSDQQENTSGLIDVVVEVKLDKSGKLRAKGFNRSNHDIIYEESPYTQGIGISYKQEFNKLSDIWRKQKNIKRKKKKDINSNN